MHSKSDELQSYLNECDWILDQPLARRDMSRLLYLFTQIIKLEMKGVKA